MKKRETSFLERWESSSPRRQRLIAQEDLILSVTEAICDEMQRKDINRQRLAEKLDSSKSHITQLLSGSRNMTLRTLSDLANALDLKVAIKLVPNYVSWEEHAHLPVRFPEFQGTEEISSANSDQWISAGAMKLSKPKQGEAA